MTRRTPAMVLGDGLILLLSLAAGARLCLRCYGLPAEEGAALTACLALGLLSLAVWSLPGRWAWAGAGLWAAGWAAVLLWRWESLSAGGLAVLRTLVTWWNGAARFPLPLPPSHGLRPWQAADASEAFLLFAAAGYALLLGWAAVRARRALPLLAFTLPLPLPALLAEVDLDWTALAVLAACWGARLLTGQFVRSHPAGGARAALAVLPVLLAAALGITALAPPQSYRQPDWAAATAERLMDLLPSGNGPGSGSGPLPGSQTQVDLGQAGPRRYTGTQVLRVTGDVPGPLYLRAGSYTNYTGDSWRREDVGGELFDLSPLFPGQAASEKAGPDGLHRLSVAHLLEETRDLLTPYQFAGLYPVGSLLDNVPDAVTSPVHWSVRQDAVLQLDDGTLGVYSFLYYPLDGDPRPITGDGDGYAQAEETYRPQVWNRYLAVPEGTADFLLQWRAEAEAGLDPPAVPDSPYGETLAKAARVVELLRDNARYDLDAPAMGEGDDFVRHFLEEGRGYCVHFASAAALLLRLDGVPARYVEGYLTRIPQTGSAVVSDSAAHAWVEIYLEGYGWYPVEATPAAGTGGVDPLPILPAETAPAEETPSPTPTGAPEATPAPEPNGPGGASDGPGPLALLPALLGGAVLLQAAGVLALRLTRRRRWRRLFRDPDTNAAVRAAYGWFLDLAPWGGPPPDRAVTAAAERARFSQHTLTEAERSDVLRALSRAIRAAGAALPPGRAALFRFLFRFPKP